MDFGSSSLDDAVELIKGRSEAIAVAGGLVIKALFRKGDSEAIIRTAARFSENVAYVRTSLRFWNLNVWSRVEKELSGIESLLRAFLRLGLGYRYNHKCLALNVIREYCSNWKSQTNFFQ